MKSRVWDTEDKIGRITSISYIYLLNRKKYCVTGFMILAFLILGLMQRTYSQSGKPAQNKSSLILQQMNKKRLQALPKFNETNTGQPGDADRLVQDSQNVSLVGRWANGPCTAVKVKGNYAYIGNGGYFSILNISNPTSIKLVSHILLPSIVKEIAVSGGYAYLADAYGGLRVIDVNNPKNPQEAVFFYTKHMYAIGVSVNDGYVYLACSFGGLRVIDVSDPKNPPEVGFFDTKSSVDGVSVSGGYAYLADEEACG